MSETLPNQHPEQNNWQEKLELHANAARLNGVEVSKILGSSLAESRSDFDEMYDAGTISDHAYEDETRKIDGALVELAGLKVEHEDTDARFFESDLRSLAVSLKQEQQSIPFGTAKHLELGNRRASVAYLLDQFDDQIRDPQQEIEKSVKPSELRDAIREWTNQAIESHNARIESTVGETIADSPEMQEAQARIDARFAEQAKQPQPTETVDDARQKVAEAFGGTGEKEQQALIGEIAQAAKGATRIHTDRPNGVTLKSNSGDYVPRDGFASFGDGLPQENRHGHGTMLEYGGSAEAMLFAPDTTTRYKTVTKTVETGGRFMKKTQQVEEQVPDGEIPTMVVNPATGQQEPGVKVAYQFNGNNRKENGQTAFYEGPAYVTESGRGGNQLFVEATLPKSVADKLKQSVADNPEIAREFAKTLVMNNGVTEQVWNKVVRPPYDQVPNGWEMTVADLQLNQYGYHDVTARQAVRVSH